MAKIVSANNKVVLSDGLADLVESEVVKDVPQTHGLEKKEDFFNWCASRGYVPKEILEDHVCGENIFCYLAQNGIVYRDSNFFERAVCVLEKRAVELVGETKFRNYKNALTESDNLTRQFRVLRSVFESRENPLAALLVDQIIWDTYIDCLKEYSPHITEFGSSTIDAHLDTKEAYRLLSMLVGIGEGCKTERESGPN